MFLETMFPETMFLETMFPETMFPEVGKQRNIHGKHNVSATMFLVSLGL